MLPPAMMAAKYLSTERKQFYFHIHFYFYLGNKRDYGFKSSLISKCPICNVENGATLNKNNSIDQYNLVTSDKSSMVKGQIVYQGIYFKNLVGKIHVHSEATKKSWSIRRMISYMYSRGTKKSVYLPHTFKNRRNTERIAIYSSWMIQIH